MTSDHQALSATRFSFAARGRIAEDLVVIYGLGDGSSDALATGRAGPDGEAPVVDFIPGLSRYLEKGQIYSNGLRNWLRRNPGASDHDRRVAQSLYDELQAAMRGQ